jgi:hypothetical protein
MKFHRQTPKGSDRHRTNSIEIPQTVQRNRVSGRPTYTERRWRERTRRTTRNRSSATAASRSIDERTDGTFEHDDVRRRVDRPPEGARHIGGDDVNGRTRSTPLLGDPVAGTHRGSAATIYGASSCKRRRRWRLPRRHAQHMLSPMATRSFVPSSNGTFTDSAGSRSRRVRMNRARNCCTNCHWLRRRRPTTHHRRT